MQRLSFTNGKNISVNLTEDPFGITEWEGFSGVDMEVQSQTVPFVDGSVFIDAYLENRELAVTLAMQDNGSMRTRYELRRKLISALNPKLGEGMLVYENDFIKKQIKCIPNVPVFENHNSNDSGTPKASLSFIACDPYWEDISPTIVNFSLTEQPTIVNGGDIPVQVKLNISGQCTNVRVSNVSNESQIGLTGLITEPVEISTRFGSKTVTGSEQGWTNIFGGYLHGTASKSGTTVVVGTDRNDLDNQLYGQFSNCKDFLRQEPVQAESRAHLKTLLEGRKANGIIFTTMQKFEDEPGKAEKALSDRRNIIVMADEAHRGQYGLSEKIKTSRDGNGNLIARRTVGTARIIRDSLPNASYIGFTGTPISREDRSTIEVFGDYIDVYDMTQAVLDGATRPVYYESRVIKLKLDDAVLARIDAEYDLLAQNADEEVIEKSKRELGKMEEILGAEKTINSLVDDILKHYEEERQYLYTGKAMIVAYSRAIAMKIFNRILELRPRWAGTATTVAINNRQITVPGDDARVAVVMTESNKDPEEWRAIIGNKTHRQELAARFKDNGSPLKIAIVVDMWLTGFDVPSLATMYVYKPMESYNLMQAIARVNRVFKDKEGGLVVDYVGIASALKQAMNDYTVRDRENYGEMDVAKRAFPKFQEKLEVCRNLFFGCDYSAFYDGTALQRGMTISGAVNFIMAPDKEAQKQAFIKEALMLRQSLSLCSSMVKEQMRMEAAFFESVRVLVMRLMYNAGGKKFSLKEINDRINELLKQSVKSEGVINLFSDVGEEFNLFDPKFLADVAGMKNKNLAVEMLRKLIDEQVKVYKRTNLVKSEKFSVLVQQALNRYLNGMLTNEEVIQEMLRLAKEMAAASAEGNKLGLSDEELAFYDALTKPDAVKDFYTNEELVALTRELTETLRRNKTIDWQKKESARARMRMIVKKLLKKYKYPPEGQEDALKTVISQCEMWTDAADGFMELPPQDAGYVIDGDAGLRYVAQESPAYGS